MKKIGIITALFLAATAFTISSVWKVIDKDAVKIYWELSDGEHKGTFKGIDAEIDFDATNLAKSSIKASIQVKTIDTGDAGRDGHLLKPDFFDADKYPTITFVSKEIVAGEKGFIANGDLTMRDKTLPVSVPFEFNEKEGKASLIGTMTVKPYDFGVFKGKKSENATATIKVEVPLTK